MANTIDPTSIGLTLPSGFVPGNSLSEEDQQLQMENAIKLFDDAGVDMNIVGEFYREDILGRNILNFTADAAMDTAISNVTNHIMKKTGKDASFVTPIVTSLFYDIHLDAVNTSITEEAKNQSGALGAIAAMQSYSKNLEIDVTSKGDVEFNRVAKMYGYNTKTFKPTEENKNILYGKVAEDLTADELRLIYKDTRIRQENKGIEKVDMLPMKFTTTTPEPTVPLFPITSMIFSAPFTSGFPKVTTHKMTQESFAQGLYEDRRMELAKEYKTADRPFDWDSINRASRAYAEKNKIFYDDYKQYVIEALKDTDAEIMQKPLDRLAAELRIRDVVPTSPKKHPLDRGRRYDE